LYGLSAPEFGVAFALGSAGYMLGTALAAGIVTHIGLDRTIGFGGSRLRWAVWPWSRRGRSVLRRLLYLCFPPRFLSPGSGWRRRRGSRVPCLHSRTALAPPLRSWDSCSKRPQRRSGPSSVTRSAKPLGRSPLQSRPWDVSLS